MTGKAHAGIVRALEDPRSIIGAAPGASPAEGYPDPA
jgi:hypothetical protein